MSRKILTFGYDACHRWAVLRLAGYTVQVCESIGELREQLMKGPDVDAVVMVEDIVSVPQEAIIAARSYSRPARSVRRHARDPEIKSTFDLRVPILSGPSAWLPQVEALIRVINNPHPNLPLRLCPCKVGST